MEHILKSYQEDIFFEFLVDTESEGSVVILPGFPESGKDKDLMFRLHGMEFNVFRPKFRGSFQSRGKFLERDPVQTMEGFIENIGNGEAIDLWDEEKVDFEVGEIHLVGQSFSGSTALRLCSNLETVSSLTLFSPVLNFSKHNEEFDEQNLEQLTGFVKRAYRNLYRFSFENIKERMERFEGSSLKILFNDINAPVNIFHDPNDSVVSIEHSREAVKILENAELVEHSQGHGLIGKFLERTLKEEV